MPNPVIPANWLNTAPAENGSLNPQLRTLHLIESLSERDGGPPVAVSHLAASLRSAGAHAVVVSMRTRSETDGFAPSGPEDRSHPAASIGGHKISVRFALDTWRQSTDVSAIIIHGFYGWPAIVGYFAAKVRRKPLLLQPHGVFERYQQSQSKRLKWVFDTAIGSRILRRVNAAATASTAEVLGVSDKIAREKIWVVGLGVQPQVCEEQKTVHSPIRLLSLTRLAPKKRIDVSIRAVRRLRDRNIDTQLVVAGVGDTQIEAELKHLVEELELSTYVTFPGHLGPAAKQELLDASDILVLPSENENFAITVAEAMAAGMPCVVTTAVATSEFVSDGAGVVIDSPNDVALSDAVEYIVSGADRFGDMSRRARSIADSEFSWQSVAGRWYALYAAIVLAEVTT